MFVVYILYSYKFDKSYVGYTSDLIGRFKSHNQLGEEYSKRYRPWVVIYCEYFDDKATAMKREKYFKAGVGYYERNEIIQKLK